MAKLKLSKKMTAGVITIFSVIVVVIGFWNDIQELFNPSATAEQIRILQEKCELALNQSKNFTDFNCSIIPIKPACTNNPTVVPDGLLIDDCDWITQDFTLGGNGYRFLIGFKSKDLDFTKQGYLLDIGKSNKESNRVSLFFENSYLKVRIYTNDGREELVKIPVTLEQLKSLGQLGISFGWHKITGKIFLHIDNVKDVDKLVEGGFSLDLSDTKVSLGSTIDGKLQANGYFSFFAVTEYVYPEPTVTLGSIEVANKTS